MGRLIGLLVILAACSGSDRRRDAPPLPPTDGGRADGAVPADAPGGPDGWTLDVEPATSTRRISLRAHGDGLLLIEHASSPIAFHRMTATGEPVWSWTPETGDIRHFAIDTDGHLYTVSAVEIGAGRGNRTLFVSTDGDDGSERWVTARDFTLGWCRGVCAVEANNRESIATVTLSDGEMHFSGTYTAEPRHLFGTIDLADGTLDSNETSDRVSRYRYLFDVPGPDFVGILSSSDTRERHLLAATWAVQDTAPAAAEDQWVEHPTGLVHHVAATGELVLIDQTAAVVSRATWTPPAAPFELAAASADSLAVKYDGVGGSTFAGVTLSTGATDWEASFAEDATSDISDAAIVVAEPSATAFDVTRIDRATGTTSAQATVETELCELSDGLGVALAVAERPEGAYAAHCSPGTADARVIRVRELPL
jgi:hypothetical protein